MGTLFGLCDVNLSCFLSVCVCIKSLAPVSSFYLPSTLISCSLKSGICIPQGVQRLTPNIQALKGTGWLRKKATHHLMCWYVWKGTRALYDWKMTGDWQRIGAEWGQQACTGTAGILQVGRKNVQLQKSTLLTSSTCPPLSSLVLLLLIIRCMFVSADTRQNPQQIRDQNIILFFKKPNKLVVRNFRKKVKESNYMNAHALKTDSKRMK